MLKYDVSRFALHPHTHKIQKRSCAVRCVVRVSVLTGACAKLLKCLTYSARSHAVRHLARMTYAFVLPSARLHALLTVLTEFRREP